MSATRILRFTTAFFDVSKERPNPVNPIAGESLLLWLQAQARPQLELSAPEAEDWGWYSDVIVDGRAYTIGASASGDEDDDEGGNADPRGAREWVLQIVKHRSVSEKLQLDTSHGEVKSMRTPQALRRRGAGRAILTHIMAEARVRGYTRLSLETGSMEL